MCYYTNVFHIINFLLELEQSSVKTNGRLLVFQTRALFRRDDYMCVNFSSMKNTKILTDEFSEAPGYTPVPKVPQARTTAYKKNPDAGVVRAPPSTGAFWYFQRKS